MKRYSLIFLFFSSTLLPAQDYIKGLNDTVPEFTVTTIEGKKYNIQELKGKIVVLNFWYTHCAPCVAELPDLEKLEKKYLTGEVIILSLSKDSKEETIKLLTKESIALSNIIPDTQNIHVLFGIQYYPTSVLIDKYGIIRKSCATIPFLEKSLEDILQNK